MSRHTLKLVVGLSILAACGTTVSAQEAPQAKELDKAAQADIRPIPLPSAQNGIANRHAGPVQLARKDLKTGQVTLHNIDELGASLPESVQSLLRGGNADRFFADVQRQLDAADGVESPSNQGVAEFGGEVMLDRAFGVRTLVSTTSSFPNSPVCRMVMSFGQGTATLVDSKWALTAGHCVHSGQGGTWASNVVVQPGYNNGVNTSFGTARGIALWTYTGWTNSSDFQYDIGFVELDRHIGALTGWYGYGVNTTSAFFDNNVFRTVGYPGQSGYNGQRMYARSGDFNNRNNNIVYSSPGSIPGESGSGSSRSNIIYAVMSHTYGTTTGGSVALWTSAFYDLRDARILAGTPVAADLVPLAVRTATTSKNRGGTIPSVQVLIHNYSRSSFSGTPIISMRTSSNDLITTLDPQGSLHSAGYMTIAPKASRWVTLYNVRVATTSPTGNIYLGAIINNADANTGNNATSAQDTDVLYVY